jgi:hypothetical protein
MVLCTSALRGLSHASATWLPPFLRVFVCVAREPEEPPRLRSRALTGLRTNETHPSRSMLLADVPTLSRRAATHSRSVQWLLTAC